MALTQDQKATNQDTLRHIERVRNLLNLVVIELLKRGELHDQSKLSETYLKTYSPKVSIQWIFWENNPEDAWINIKKRNDGRIISQSFLKQLSSQYNPPHIDFKVYKET